MKRFASASFFVLPVALVLSSPSLAANGLTLGGGLNVSSDDQDASGSDARKISRLGFNLGVGYEKEISPGFFLVPELNVETRGLTAKGRNEELDLDTKAALKMTYLQAPVFVMLKFSAGGTFVSLFIGPSLGLNLSSRMEIEVNGEKSSFDAKDQADIFDLGIELGAGIEFSVGSGGFFVRPGYNMGLTEYGDGADARHRNFKLKAGYRFAM